MENSLVYATVLSDKGEIERAKAEFDAALRLAPGQFEVLTFYIDGASIFGESERTAALVDRAISLNPSFPTWSARIFASAYFMAGRHEDTLRMLDRLSKENYGKKHWVMRAGTFAALGRTAEAHISMTDALRRFPNLTIEGFLNVPGFNEAERERLVETMRIVGFPECANADELVRIVSPVRLPKCALQ